MVAWGAPESDGGAPLEGYKVAVRDEKRHMWMEVGRVSADVQKLKVQELAEGNLYFLRIYAKNEVGFSPHLENEEAFKVVRPAGKYHFKFIYILFITCQQPILEFWIYQFFSQILDYNEEEAAEEAEHDKTPSLSFSATTDSSVRNFEHFLGGLIEKIIQWLSLNF